MIKLEGKGPVKEMELFFDVLCNYGFIRSRSKSFVNIEGDRSLIEAEVGVPKWICQGYPEPAADGDQRFITEEQIPDTYLPETILYRRAAGIDTAETK